MRVTILNDYGFSVRDLTNTTLRAPIVDEIERRVKEALDDAERTNWNAGYLKGFTDAKQRGEDFLSDMQPSEEDFH